ncbi:MAG: pspC [Parcubacteria group bacterium]|nr:pspC [Parcubacteria group bacterium]
MITKKLTKSSEHKVIAGVMGGIGEYFDTDPLLIRLVYIFASVFTGIIPGILGYVVAMAIIPEAPFVTHATPVPPAEVHDTAKV